MNILIEFGVVILGVMQLVLFEVGLFLGRKEQEQLNIRELYALYDRGFKDGADLYREVKNADNAG